MPRIGVAVGISQELWLHGFEYRIKIHVHVDHEI